MVGLISDTHGLLWPEAKAFLKGSNYIVHAGDICEPRILEELGLEIATPDEARAMLKLKGRGNVAF